MISELFKLFKLFSFFLFLSEKKGFFSSQVIAKKTTKKAVSACSDARFSHCEPRFGPCRTAPTDVLWLTPCCVSLSAGCNWLHGADGRCSPLQLVIRPTGNLGSTAVSLSGLRLTQTARVDVPDRDKHTQTEAQTHWRPGTSQDCDPVGHLKRVHFMSPFKTVWGAIRR